MASDEKTGVILMTYGSATVASGVPAYLNRIYPEGAPATLIATFTERYQCIGESPLIRITREQAARLEASLGFRYIVQAGMRYSEPSIQSAVALCKQEGATRLVGVVLSPQFSPSLMDGYTRALVSAAHACGYADDAVSMRAGWPTERHFISLTARRISEELRELEKQYGAAVPIIFTTHSLPKRAAQKSEGYLAEIEATVRALVDELRLPPSRWFQAYQSAGHKKEDWLTPDVIDILPEVARSGARAVLMVPVQFLADHLEVLYDLDIAVRDQCNVHHLAYHRIPLPNTDPEFIAALKSVVLETESA